VSGELVATAARFSDRVEDYVRYRPSYPPAAIDAIFAGLGDPRDLRVVDVGAGTGISSRLLAERGARVVALEPNPEMRAAALRTGLDARDGLADRTGLADESVDVVTAFQAFHWFANDTALREFVRILAPRGRIALVWNMRDDEDAFTREYGDIADRNEKATATGVPEDYDDYVPALLRGGGFANVRRRGFPNSQRLDLDSLLGRARSASYVPREGAAWEAIATELRTLHARYAKGEGTVPLVYRTIAYLADKRRA
jgi:SAM-dependent methyltransferase